MRLTERHHQLLQRVRDAQALSRRDLHLGMGLRPNTIGELVEELIAIGLICEGKPEPMGRGRPQVPLCIDTDRCSVVGIAVQNDAIRMTCTDLQGQRLGKAKYLQRGKRTGLQRDLLKVLDQLHKHQAGADRTLVSIGISFPGLIDVEASRITSSATSARAARVDVMALAQVVEEFGAMLVVDNDMHAIAAQWLLSNQLVTDEDTLLIYLNDNAVGSAMLIDGRPNRGCILGGNEIGHMRFSFTTDPARQPPMCYCEHVGCLEQIFSTRYLNQLKDQRPLREAAGAFEDEPGPMSDITDCLASGLANCINFVRPHRVHLISPMASCPTFQRVLETRIQGRTLAPLTDRVTIEWSAPPEDEFALAAAWLGLTAVYLGNWSHGYADNGK